LIEDEPNLDDRDLMTEVSQVFNKDLELKTNIIQSKGKDKEILPEIKIDSDSDKSMDKYFPEAEVTQEEVKSKFTNIMDKIRSKINSPITGSPQVAQVGLHPELSPLDELVNKGENLPTFEDLKNEYKESLLDESLNLNPDTLIDKFKDLDDFTTNSYLDDIVIRNIDNSILKLNSEHPD
jgi:hypothetical protein